METAKTAAVRHYRAFANEAREHQNVMELVDTVDRHIAAVNEAIAHHKRACAAAFERLAQASRGL